MENRPQAKSSAGISLRTARGAFAALAAASLIGGAITACGGEESVEDLVSRACTDTIHQYRPIGPSGPNSALTSEWVGAEDADLIEMSFEDVTATSTESSGATEIWDVKGSATAEWEKRVKSTTWEDDGKPDPLPPVTEKFSCEVGYRSTDQEIVVFEYTTYHPTSGGSEGRVLVEREGASS